MCHLNLCIKNWGSPSSFRRKRPVISLNCSAFIENLSSSECARARARANHAKNDAQKGCAMQLKGITLNNKIEKKGTWGKKKGKEERKENSTVQYRVGNCVVLFA